MLFLEKSRVSVYTCVFVRVCIRVCVCGVWPYDQGLAKLPGHSRASSTATVYLQVTLLFI